MSPVVKYTLGRIGLFVAVLLVLWPLDLNILIKMMVAVLVSAVLSIFVLRRWRNEWVASRCAGAVERRSAERERLRSALAGEDEREYARVRPDRVRLGRGTALGKATIRCPGAFSRRRRRYRLPGPLRSEAGANPALSRNCDAVTGPRSTTASQVACGVGRDQRSRGRSASQAGTRDIRSLSAKHSDPRPTGG